MPHYRARPDAPAGDSRLFSDVFPRNSPPLIAALAPWLGSRRGPVLEIGCGTGQHAAAFDLAFADLDWHASDPDPLHRASAAAWRAHLKLPPRPVLDIDAAGPWADGLDHAGAFEAVFSANVIHISPVAVMQGILREAPRALAPGGLVIFYGPFTEAGRHNSPGNAAFDRQLRARNADWGLRDLTDLHRLAERHALAFAGLRAMPANNRLVIYRRA